MDKDGVVTTVRKLIVDVSACSSNPTQEADVEYGHISIHCTPYSSVVGIYKYKNNFLNITSSCTFNNITI